MRKQIVVGTLVFIVVAIATWFLIPPQPLRVRHASDDPDRVFVRVLPGGRWALTASVKKDEDNFGRINIKNVAPIRLYDLSNGREIQDLISKGEMWSYSLAKLSPDGKLLAVSIEDKFPSFPLHIWDLESMKLLATLPRHNSNSMESDRDICRFSPDGRFVAYATSTRRDEISENGHVKVAENWQLRRWNKVDGSDVLVGPFSWMSLVAFSPDSKQLALGFSTFRTSDGSKHSTLKPQVPYANPHVSQWTPNGENLALVAPRYDLEKPNRIDVTFWNPLTNETRQLVLNADSALRLRSANFSHDGRYLFLQNDMFFSEIWAIDVDPPARVGFTRAEDFGPTPKQPSAVIGENPVRQRLWKIDTPLDQAPIMPYMGYGINSIHFNYDRSLVSIEFSGKPFKSYNDIWDTNSLKHISQFQLKGRFLGFSNSGKTFFEIPPGESPSYLSEWDVNPSLPWRWLIPICFAEAGLIAWLTRWSARRKRFSS
ncbi:MAG: hypothetical protein LW724_12805 [Planctomycetaceae bacterium]|jgi:hypothetical protein|nr:hypothetical protein [Planctomycetaceae bacterium]